MSGYMSIVTKLSINASKSRIRIFNIHPNAQIPPFQYTAWTHSGKTVCTTNLTNIDFITTTGIMSTTAPHKLFGVYTTMKGNTRNHAYKDLFSINRRQNHLFKQHLQGDVLVTQYTQLIISVVAYNPLLGGIDLQTCLNNDKSILPKLRRQYNITSNEPSHQIFTPPSVGGLNLPTLMFAMLSSIIRELTVTLCTPHLPLVPESTRHFPHCPPPST